MQGPGQGQGGGSGPYDENQVGYVSPLGIESCYQQGYQAPWLGQRGVETAGSPYQYWYQEQPLEQPRDHDDHGVTAESSSPYDSQDHVYRVPPLQIPTVRVQRPNQAPQEHQRLSVRVSSGPNGGLDEVSPLSSSGSGPPYRVSAMSGLGRPQ